MPDPIENPVLAAIARRTVALRAELDRLDDHIDRLEPANRVRLLPRVVALREGVDELAADVEVCAAGGDGPVPSLTEPTIAEPTDDGGAGP